MCYRKSAILSSTLGIVWSVSPACVAQRFFPDDPLWREPAPVPVNKINVQKLDNLIDFYKNTFHEKGERHRPGHIIPSAGVNTLGEVPDSAWYTNRHRPRRMSVAELATGPNRTGPPSGDRWTVTAAKAEGVTPGFTIRDGAGRKYLLKFDPKQNVELATGADVVCAKFFYALGYNVPENYPVRFRREQLVPGEDVRYTDSRGNERKLDAQKIDELLKSVPQYEDGRYRGLASLYLSGEPVGPFKYYGRRADDPNELAPHEHLRVLRGLYVFAAWLNHTDAKSLNSLDMVVEENGRRYVKHYLIDFGATLGSDSLYAKDPRLGHEYFLAAGPGARQLASLGLYVPKYARVDYPDNPAVGNFSADAFEPDAWKSNYPNAAFESRLPGDEFWAAKQVMAFTDQEIRALVQTGGYSNPDTAREISDILIARRNAIGRTFFAKVLPLDSFRIQKGTLVFEDLAARHGLSPERRFDIAWSRFDNATGTERQGSAGSGPAVPRGAGYWVARISTGNHPRAVKVFIHSDSSGAKVVGIERDGENEWRPR